ncbi:MAG: aspartokinase/homoserine dehydrogenase 1, partial [Bacteroidia bacterium]
MKILKFGGTSVGNSENITRVKEILTNQSESFIVVVSAFSGTTNLLESLANWAIADEHRFVLKELEEKHHGIISELLNSTSAAAVLELVDSEFKKLETICTGISALQELSDKTLARVFSFGETVSSKIIHSYLLQEGININHIDSSRLIVAEGSPLSAMVDFKTTNQRITDTINPTKSYICGGFIAKSSAGSNVVLGRGGSDLTASIFAQALNVSKLEIWSDVNGMLNANPRVVKEASPISSLSYQEAFELAYFGAKVLYPPTIRPVMEKNIPIYLKNTLKPEDEGTFISGKNEDDTDRITGVTSLQDISIVTISGVGLAGKKGTARRVFQVI